MNQDYFKNITVVGAGGQIGGYIVRALLDQGKHNVAAFTHLESNSGMLFDLAVVKKVEYDSHSALVESLQGQDALVISLNSAHGVRHQRVSVMASGLIVLLVSATIMMAAVNV